MELLQEWSSHQSPLSFARAVVVSNSDPDALGRIQVKYPWCDPGGESPTSHWARVLSPFASHSAGWLSLPNPDDEVLVCFEGGNMDTPIVLGALFSQARPIPEHKNSKNSPGKVSVLKSKLGHTVVIDDTGETNGITLQTKNGHQLVLSDTDRAIEVKDAHENQIQLNEKGVEIQDRSGNQLKLSEGGICIQSAKKIELTEGASEALVKGKTFVKLFNTHTHNHPLGPTSPPATPLQEKAVLSEKVMVK